MIRPSRAMALLPLLAASTGPALAQGVPPLINARVELRFNELQLLTEPVHFVVVPDNGPEPQPRAELEVTIMTDAGDPWPDVNVFVVFDAAAAQSECWCATQRQATWLLADGRRVFHATTGPDGLALFQIGAGGCIERSSVVFLKAGAPGPPNSEEAVPFRAYNVVSSMDNSGAAGALCDRAVNLVDLVHYAASHIGAYQRCHDYNGDGAVNIVDLQIYAQHHVRAALCQ